MKTYNYTYINIENEEYFKILITKLDDTSYFKEVLVDNSIKDIVKAQGVRILNTGYVVLRGSEGHKPLQHLVLNHTSNMSTVVDHINGNILDNRKSNLRVLTQANNANNRTKNSRCNTGIVGIAKRSKGNYTYFRATVSDRATAVVGSKAKSQTKRYSKQFNINKLGEEKAMEQAKAWLKHKRAEFNYV
mgnify:CR=1 FL=1